MYNDPFAKIRDFYVAQKRMPTYSEMMGIFGFKSKNAVARLVQKLIDAGTLAKDATGRLMPTNLFDEIPMLGSVKAGLPSDTAELFDETINLNDFLAPKRGKTYLVTVDGDSMIDAHIQHGDLVIAERSETARDGDIVIANVDGECTMKYLRHDRNGSAYLQPANERYGDIYPEQFLTILAIVRGVVRKY